MLIEIFVVFYISLIIWSFWYFEVQKKKHDQKYQDLYFALESEYEDKKRQNALNFYNYIHFLYCENKLSEKDAYNILREMKLYDWCEELTKDIERGKTPNNSKTVIPNS